MFFNDHPEGLLIDVQVQPKSSQNAIVGLHGEALKVKLNAPPVEGKANKALIKMMAKCLGCPKSDVDIIAGQASRKKRLLVHIAPGASFEARRESMKAVLQSHIR
jgi:uncharacterized protein (TIGR00251 family)